MECQGLSLCVCLFPNSSETTKPDEIKRENKIVRPNCISEKIP